MPTTDRLVRVSHVYEHDSRKFEEQLNLELRHIVENGGVIGDIKYASDPATAHERRGGFGALVVYEIRADAEIRARAQHVEEEQ
jgi:hypothetical protein